eukprot:COSAG01_NODE_422_length_17262_cov_42.635903_2_plen_51_part_00
MSAIRYIGGFGEMSWVPTQEYSAALVDPVGEPSKLRVRVEIMGSFKISTD